MGCGLDIFRWVLPAQLKNKTLLKWLWTNLLSFLDFKIMQNNRRYHKVNMQTYSICLSTYFIYIWNYCKAVAKLKTEKIWRSLEEILIKIIFNLVCFHLAWVILQQICHIIFDLLNWYYCIYHHFIDFLKYFLWSWHINLVTTISSLILLICIYNCIYIYILLSGNLKSISLSLVYR